jgi:hypothetical protein
MQFPSVTARTRATAANVCAVSLLIAGCSGGASSSPSPPRTSPTASATPRLSASPAPVQVPTCRVPVASSATGANQMAGFISLPSGTFQTDAGARMLFDTGRSRVYTVQTPVLYGDSGATWDPAFRRWLPVAKAQVLSDGSAYVYTREATPTPQRNEIHLVTVATGADRVVYNQDAYDAFAYVPEGIVLMFHLNGTDGAHGLWLLDPGTGSLKAFPNGAQAWWVVMGDGGAWSYSVDGNRFGSSELARLDLASGTVATWFSVTSTPPVPLAGSRSVHVIGFDASLHPIVEVYVFGGTPEVWLAPAPAHATRLSGLSLSDFTPQLGERDSHGTWIAGADGLYLYTDAGFQRVAPNPPGWDAGYAVAGACA